jgi:hypothetical protein
MRREAFVLVGGYRAAFVDAEDYDLWLRLADKFDLANLEPVVIRYRLHPNQTSKQRIRQQTLSTLAAQAAASSRKSGKREVLCSTDEITSEILTSLGVSEEAQQTALALQYLRWIGNMSLLGEYSDAFNLWTDLFESGCWKELDRRLLADVWLAGASLYWRQKQFLPSLQLTARALLLRPIVAGRPIKRAARWLGSLLNSRARRSPVVTQ